jgi:hypothetical protein
VNVYRSRLDARGGLDASAHKAVERRALFGGGSRGDIRGVKQKAQKGGLAGTLSASNLVRVSGVQRRDLARDQKLTIRLNFGGTRARR